jgi:hypothetical protein
MKKEVEDSFNLPSVAEGTPLSTLSKKKEDTHPLIQEAEWSKSASMVKRM